MKLIPIGTRVKQGKFNESEISGEVVGYTVIDNNLKYIILLDEHYRGYLEGRRSYISYMVVDNSNVIEHDRLNSESED